MAFIEEQKTLALAIVGRICREMEGRAHWNCPWCDEEICSDEDHESDCRFRQFSDLYYGR